MNSRLITILGPTATGKTAIATRIAAMLDGEIISADSRQIYRGMDIGTGKDLSEYKIGDKNIPYHLIDIRPAGYKYNLYEYQRDFFHAYEKITQKGKEAILCGGTGLYIEAVLGEYRLLEVPVNNELRMQLEGKDLQELSTILNGYPEYHRHNKTDADTIRRAIRAIEIADYYAQNNTLNIQYPKLTPLIIGIDISRELRRKRITDRLYKRLDEGMINEVKDLLNSGIPHEDLMYYGLEYKFITQYVIGRLSYDEMVKNLEIAIHQFAKRQMTWFRGMERRGYEIHWIDGSQSLEDKVESTANIIKNHTQTV